MKFKSLFAASLAIAAVLPAAADITVVLPEGQNAQKVYISSIPVAEYAGGRKAVKTIENDSVAIVNGKAVLKTPAFNAVNRISFAADSRQRDEIFTAPGDNVTLSVVSLEPLQTTVKGTELLDNIQGINDRLIPIYDKANKMQAAGTLDDASVEKLYDEIDGALMDYVKNNYGYPAACYAVMNMQRPQAVIEAYKLLDSQARTSIIGSLAEAANARALKSIEAEKNQEALKTGNAVAPDFTLPGIDGKNITLSQFRGKWLILDFWGSWCMWCVKGFPSLKEAYQKYAGELEILGVDCGDTREAWKAAVERFKLPWKQCYNGDGQEILSQYGVEGFPTKLIISPEGKVVDLTTGEDPSFFDRLAKLMGK